MNRSAVLKIIAGAAGALLVAWVVSHTYWDQIAIPIPPHGEALTDPSYAAEKLVTALGGRVVHSHLFEPPPVSSVVVLEDWNWSLSGPRRNAIERWVEAGGRLVVDRTVGGNMDEFARWSGISHRFQTVAEPAPVGSNGDNGCRTVYEHHEGGGPLPEARYELCGPSRSWLAISSPYAWRLADNHGTQAVRVHVGRGTVTMVNATPFDHQSLFDGDHAAIFIAATAFRRGDDVRFLSEDEYPSLLALLWRAGRPVLLIAMALVCCLIWRDGIRFGPPAAAPLLGRRSLADQIRGTGRFLCVIAAASRYAPRRFALWMMRPRLGLSCTAS